MTIKSRVLPTLWWLAWNPNMDSTLLSWVALLIVSSEGEIPPLKYSLKNLYCLKGKCDCDRLMGEINEETGSKFFKNGTQVLLIYFLR